MLPSHANWFQLITLQRTGRHLWTIPPEICYYLIIPVICLVFNAVSYNDVKHSRKFLFLSVHSICCTLGCNFNIQHIPDTDLKDDSTTLQGMHTSPQTGFRLSVFVFLTGSLLAFVFHTMLSLEHAKRLLEHRTVQWILEIGSVLALFAAYHTSVYDTQINYSVLSKAGFRWAIVLFLLLISSSQNRLKNFLENSSFLASCGKYSFGIYLLHLAFIFFATYCESLKILRRLSEPEYEFVFIAVCFFLGKLWYQLLEKRMIDLANRICKSLEPSLILGQPKI